ncbi:MAG: NAD(P)-dependent oxidoreductase, partial [Leptolyngbyaceae cyanobacterium CAN_BIN12]|nr:NAD(P)-dependent oxidoreductase [Leptolyngbyaceae cyanobacterium CAN_BIN12]
MTSKRIFVTGASGCIGHYIVETLIQETNHDLFLLVRNPDKLKIDYTVRPGITVLQGNMREIEQFSDLLKTIDCAILIATAWGGPEEVYDINVVKTIRLLNLLDPEICQLVFYFSTASILDRNNQPLKEAGEVGTDYI